MMNDCGEFGLSISTTREAAFGRSTAKFLAGAAFAFGFH
jgi:hypothetical protein